jgi:hypothetical protein
MTWDIEVRQAAEYDATIYYTCGPGDVGSTVSLSLGASRVQAKIAEAHDPPLIGKAFDRFDRGQESYVKDFRPLKLGRLRLEKGRGLLTLSATEIPGQQVADIRYVALTR